jgi:hypothetical protein
MHAALVSTTWLDPLAGWHLQRHDSTLMRYFLQVDDDVVMEGDLVTCRVKVNILTLGSGT